MDNSILNTINKMLGNTNGDFDTDVIIHINSILSIYQRQIGRSPEAFVQITGPNETWDLLNLDDGHLSDFKTYLYLRVKKLFDPPTGGTMEALNSSIAEFEWRLSIE